MTKIYVPTPPAKGGIFYPTDLSKYEFKTVVAPDVLKKKMQRIAHEINEHNARLEDVVLVAIMSGGVPIAEYLQKLINEMFGVSVVCDKIDVTAHRDDIDFRSLNQPQPSDMEYSIVGKDIVLVDDVFSTGRTARAAINALFTYGRPSSVQLAVIARRPHLEMPIDPNYVGKFMPTNRGDYIRVTVEGGIEIGRPTEVTLP